MQFKSQPGDEVGIYYDSKAQVLPGDYLRTRTGRTYRIVKVRRQVKGQHEGRCHLRCVVMDPDQNQQCEKCLGSGKTAPWDEEVSTPCPACHGTGELPLDVAPRVHPLYWYSRSKKRGRRLS